MKKRSFTLLEVLISFSLLTVLMSTLFYFYWKAALDKKELDHIFSLKFEERTCAIRLKKFLAVGDPLFFSDGKEVVGIFNNGIDNDPLLSQEVLGKLHVDKNINSLCLTLWPHPKTELTSPSKTYTLLPKVKALSFEFYTTPESLIIDPEWVGEDKPPVGWVKSWKKSYAQLPDAMKLLVQRSDDKEVTFVYPFGTKRKPILLRRE